jgi:hypothetical protein
VEDEKRPNLIYLKNKKYGITYVYEDHPYWVPSLQQSRSKRICIGKIDPTTGNIVPTRGCRKKETKVPDEEAMQDDSLLRSVSCKFCGATYLPDSIGENLGIVDDLTFCFPGTCEQIKSSQEKRREKPASRKNSMDKIKLEFVARITLPNGEVIERRVTAADGMPAPDDFDISSKDGFLESFDAMEKVTLEARNRIAKDIAEAYLEEVSEKKKK